MRKGRAVGVNLHKSIQLKNKYNLNPILFHGEYANQNNQSIKSLLPLSCKVSDRKKLKTLLNLNCNYFKNIWKELYKQELRPFQVEVPVGIISISNPISTGVDLMALDYLNRFTPLEIKTTVQSIDMLTFGYSYFNIPCIKHKLISQLNRFFLQLLITYRLFRVTYPQVPVGIPKVIVSWKDKAITYPLTDFIDFVLFDIYADEIIKYIQ